jgi:hypothetical protein
MAARRSRRSSGEGAVFQRKSDGLWVGMLDLGIVGGRRRRRAVYGHTEEQARTKLRKLQDAQARGLALLAQSHTVEQWLDLWLSDIKAHDGTRPATLTLYQGLADHYVKPVIGPVRLDRLTPRHVQRLIVETRNAETSRRRPPSAATQRQVHTLIRNALGDAYRLELVTRNVAAQVKAPPMARQRRPARRRPGCAGPGSLHHSPGRATPPPLRMPADSAALARHLAFRDFLRTHQTTARAYGQLKRSLAMQFRTDRAAYTEAETQFIEQVLNSVRPIA